MPRILAIDWDQHEARCVLASATGKKVQVLAAEAVPLVDVAEGGEASHPDLGGSLRAMLSEQRTGRAAVLVGVHRAAVELMNFSLPPAKDAELAQLVVIQATRESQTLGQEATLDFVAISEDPRASREVMAAVLPGEMRREVDEACAKAGVKPNRIVLRQLAAASLFLRSVAPQQPCLLVNLVADEADLTVVCEGRAVFLRSVRLPEKAGEDVVQNRLVAEINRTLVVAQQGPLGGASVETVYLFGALGEHDGLIGRIRGAMQLEVKSVDPFESVDVSDVEVPASAGRYASLLGMVLDEVHASHAIDFLHPRKPPRPPNRRRTFAIAAGIALALAIGGGYYYWSLLREADDLNAQYASRVLELDKLLKANAKQQQLIDSVRAWKAGEIVWLDELRELSLRMPPSRDAVVQQMTMSGGRGNKGVIALQGVVRNPSVVAQIDQSLHDAYHTVDTRRVGEHPRGDEYAWHFDRSISVTPRGLAAPAAKPAPTPVRGKAKP